MRETEITVEVFEGVSAVIEKLKAQGFEVMSNVVMTDYYYSRYPMDILDKFKYEDMIKNSFVLRKLDGENNEVQLIYKDKELDAHGAVISEEKIKCKIPDFNKSVRIFDSAGLNRWMEIKQDMYLMQKDSVVFMLQDVDGLGLFIEYEEDHTMSGLSPHEKMEKMSETLRGLGLLLGNDFSCKKVYMKYLKRRDCKNN
ncbi:MAG: hypothetical protein E7354_05500 [Clostridiales bacterium]|nr:hypothetical protein [Clostridiales bacterium]